MVRRIKNNSAFPGAVFWNLTHGGIHQPKHWDAGTLQTVADGTAEALERIANEAK